MPRHDMTHPAGRKVPTEIRELLSTYFSENDIIRLERLGGNVSIVLTVPYRPKGNRRGSPSIVDQDFISGLHDTRNSSADLRKQIEVLNVKQLKVLGNLVGHPLRTTSTRAAMVDEIVSYFRAEDVWERIVGKPPS